MLVVWGRGLSDGPSLEKDRATLLLLLGQISARVDEGCSPFFPAFFPFSGPILQRSPTRCTNLWQVETQQEKVHPAASSQTGLAQFGTDWSWNPSLEEGENDDVSGLKTRELGLVLNASL